LNKIVYPVRKNEELELSVERTAFGGKGLAHVDDYVIFIKNAVPGDIVKTRIIKRKPNYAEAQILEIIKASPMRKDAPCPYFGWCGGCNWQNLDYQDQLQIKKDHVMESLMHMSDLKDVQVHNTLPSPRIWGYRNKMEFSFSDRRWLLPVELDQKEITRSYALGLHIPGTFDKILDIDYCYLQSETANTVLQIIDRYIIENGLKPYGIKSHEGFLRFLVIRESAFNEDILVNLVTGFKDKIQLEPLAQILHDKVSHVSGVVNTINRSKAQVATGDEEITLSGRNYIIEKLGPFEYKISANSFFQTNTLQAERLYQSVLDAAGLSGDEIVWDLYSGTGTISMLLATKAKYVIGFEIGKSAVDDAVSNTRDHGLENTRFLHGDIANTIQQESSTPDVIIIDPPRVGMHPKVCAAVADSAAQRLVYVSCNPTTLARDIKILLAQYTVIHVQPVDMFPHSYHIETVTLLEKR
jgi:23S rRNA (uracil1939-C5)-methyltransferase